MQQALQSAQQRIDELEAERQGKLIEASVKREDSERSYEVEAYKAETERMVALGPAITPEQVQLLVVQTIQQMLAAPPIGEETGETFENTRTEAPDGAIY